MTAEEFFLSLPGEYRDRALANLVPRHKGKERGCLASALITGFSWDESPEGGGFWSDMHEACRGDLDTIDFTKLPPIPK